jgi:hypothetical protein
LSKETEESYEIELNGLLLDYIQYSTFWTQSVTLLLRNLPSIHDHPSSNTQNKNMK